MEADPITRLSNYMLNKSYISAFVVMLGFGGELISYLAGLSKLNYLKFLSIIVFTNFINALLFVGSNLTIGTNNTLYISINTINFLITALPLIIVFRKEIWSYFKKLISIYNTYKIEDAAFKQAIQDYKSKQLEFLGFSKIYLNQIKSDIEFNLKLLYKFAGVSGENNNLEPTIKGTIFSIIKGRRKLLTKSKIDNQTINKLYRLSQEKYLAAITE
jgi:hypothetical protein